MEEQLQRKVDRAIKLLQSTCKDQQVELSYSGGKDSDVILELAKMAGINYRAIYKCTTIDPPGTIKHCLDNGVEIIRPKISFLQIIEKKGFPTRRARFCCECLKEYKVMDKAIQGIRCSESTKRAKYYKEPTMCRTYGSKKKKKIMLMLSCPFLILQIRTLRNLSRRGVLSCILCIITKTEVLMSRNGSAVWAAH